jgi:hypothetical protein
MNAPIGFLAGILFAQYVKKDPQGAKAMGIDPLELGALLLVLRDTGAVQNHANATRLWEAVGNLEDAELAAKYKNYHAALVAQTPSRYQVALSNSGAGKPKEAPYVARLRRHREQKAQERDMKQEIQAMSPDKAQQELMRVNRKIQSLTNRGRPNARAMVGLDTKKFWLEDKLGLN